MGDYVYGQVDHPGI